LSCLFGAAASALVPRLPAGAIIVTTACGIFLVSMVFAPERGALPRWIEHRRLARKIERQHLLRALFEWFEESVPDLGSDGSGLPPGTGVPVSDLLKARAWTPRRLHRLLASAERGGFAYRIPDGGVRLTDEGLAEARRVVRNHRLWELYLITHADIAPSHVDRGADEIEHVLGRAMVEKLEALLAGAGKGLPVSPHPLRVVEGRGPEATA
jgi:manganese/zinc/iron transport system permease protein